MAECFMKRVENTVGKGEIARHEQFLLFPQCFQKTYATDTLKPGLVWERVEFIFILREKLYFYVYSVLSQKIVGCIEHRIEKLFKNIEGKEENAGYKHFLLFPQCFLLCHGQILPFKSCLICRLQML